MFIFFLCFIIYTYLTYIPASNTVIDASQIMSRIECFYIVLLFYIQWSAITQKKLMASF